MVGFDACNEDAVCGGGRMKRSRQVGDVEYYLYYVVHAVTLNCGWLL
jgi:hypothetical protein